MPRLIRCPPFMKFDRHVSMGPLLGKEEREVELGPDLVGT